MKIGLAFDLGKLRLECVLRVVLHRGIKRGVNRQSAIIHLVLGQDQAQSALHGIHCVVLLDLWHWLGMRDNFCPFCLAGLRWGNFFQCHHAIKDRIALDRRPPGIFQGRKAIWAPNQAGQQRSLRKVQL